MEEGLYDKKQSPEEAWFFLKTILFARDQEELSYKEKRMNAIFVGKGGIEFREIAENAMGA